MLSKEQKRIFSDLEKILRGITGKNLSVGIISGENSMGKQLPDAENNKRNDELYRKLKSFPNTRVFPLQGNFEGVLENSYLVTGLSLKELTNLAKEFGQLSFIYGNGTNDNVIFHYMEVDNEGEYKDVQIRRTFIFADKAKDNYSSYKGVKFVIPFFNDKYVNKRRDDLSSEERGGEIDNEEEGTMEDTRFGRISKLLDTLKIDEKEKVKIKVKHSDLLEIPEDKNFWDVPFKHYTELVDKKGYAKVIRALNNIKTWNKNDDPDISKKADALIDKLKSKFKPEKSEAFGDMIKNNIPRIHSLDGVGKAIGAGTPEQIEKAKFIAKVKSLQAQKEGKRMGMGSVSKADLDNYDHYVQLHRDLTGEEE